MVFGCEKHRDHIKTNNRYVDERKVLVVSDNITSGSPKCSRGKVQDK